MRSTLAILTAICVGGALVGCSKNSSQSTTGPKKSIPNESAPASVWNLRLDSNCAEGVTLDQCVAKFGFSIQLNEGNFVLGPAPSGESRNGKLTEDELQALKLALGNEMSNANARAENHATIEATEGADTISLGQSTGTADVLIKSSGTSLDFKLQSTEQAQTLLKLMKSLAEKYYALPFPDQCIDRLDSVRSLLASVQTCTTNTDCSYTDIDFSSLDLPAATYVTTDDCKLIRPLAVANTNLLKTNQEKLINAYSEIAGACGDRFFKANCTVSGFEPNGAAPVCEQGLCKVGTPATPAHTSHH